MHPLMRDLIQAAADVLDHDHDILEGTTPDEMWNRVQLVAGFRRVLRRYRPDLVEIDAQAVELASLRGEVELLRRVVNGATSYLAAELGPDADEALHEWRAKYGNTGA